MKRVCEVNAVERERREAESGHTVIAAEGEDGPGAGLQSRLGHEEGCEANKCLERGEDIGSTSKRMLWYIPKGTMTQIFPCGGP
jgi:hypothetical protein